MTYALAGSTVSTILSSSVLIRFFESAVGSSMSSVGEAERFLVADDDVVVTSMAGFSPVLFF